MPVARAIACAVLSVSMFGAASDTGTLSGLVRDPSGAVVQDVAVLLVCRAADQKERHFYTDVKGEYSVELTPGSCDVFFSHGLFEPVAKSVRIEAGKKVVFNLQLKFRKGLKFIE